MVNKIKNTPGIHRVIAVILFTTIASRSFTQDSTYTRPPVVSSWKEYAQQVLHDPEKKMIELRTLIPGLRYDLRYAGNNNFMHRQMYPANTHSTFLRAPVAEALSNVDAELKEKGLGLKIFDAYRPYSVTVAFWELVHDERYVANPSRGSGHNRGLAVDLTLVNRQTGAELPMGKTMSLSPGKLRWPPTNPGRSTFRVLEAIEDAVSRFGNAVPLPGYKTSWPLSSGCSTGRLGLDEGGAL